MAKSTRRVSPGEVFRERVRDIRDKRGWKQEELARAILKVEGKPERENGVGNINRYRVRVARTETGERKASVDEVFAFAAALGVSPLVLLLPKEITDTEQLIAVTGSHEHPGLTLETIFVAGWLLGRGALDEYSSDIYGETFPYAARDIFMAETVQQLLAEGLAPRWEHAQILAAERIFVRGEIANMERLITREEKSRSDIDEDRLEFWKKDLARRREDVEVLDNQIAALLVQLDEKETAEIEAEEEEK